MIDGAAHISCGLQRAGRRLIGVDLGIAFIRRDQEIMLPREREPVLQIVERGDRPLRISRGAKIDHRRLLECRVILRIERRHESMSAIGGEEDRLAPAAAAAPA